MSNSANNPAQTTDTDPCYLEALRRIAELNEQVRQKDQLINGYLKEMRFMKEKMDDCLKSLNHILSQLVAAEANFKTGQDLLLKKINDKDQIILELEQANDAWAERTIKLEFELLSARSGLR